jgi:serine/threonine protein kinase
MTGIKRFATVDPGSLGSCAILQGNNTIRTSRIGPVHYMAPEMMKEEPYNVKVDIWALGITTMEMLEGKPPYHTLSPELIIYNVTEHGAPPLNQPDSWSGDLTYFLSCCLCISISERTSATELLDSGEFLRSKLQLRLAVSIQNSPPLVYWLKSMAHPGTSTARMSVTECPAFNMTVRNFQYLASTCNFVPWFRTLRPTSAFLMDRFYVVIIIFPFFFPSPISCPYPRMCI